MLKDNSLTIDDIDLKIIKEFYDLKPEEETTTWIIMSKLFHEEKNMERLRNYHQLIRNRIRRLNPDIFIVEKSPETKKYEYHLISDNVRFGRHKFPEGYRKSISLKINSMWRVMELNN